MSKLSKVITFSGILGVALLPFVAGAQPTETEVAAASYLCERGVTVPVVYVNAPDRSFAVIVVEGRQLYLPEAVSGSGARYRMGEGEDSYVWWTKGDEASLSWEAGDNEVSLLTECKATG